MQEEKEKKEANKEPCVGSMWMYIDTDFNKVFDFTTQKNGTVNQYILRICEDYQPQGQWN